MTIKKSFLLHVDSLDVLDHLTDEQCGQLLKAFKAFHLGEELKLNPMLNIAFTPFKNQFSRDHETYENVCNRNRINGMKGGRPVTQKTQVVNSITQDNPEKPKEPDSDSDNDSDSKKDKDSVNGNETYKAVEGLNLKAFGKYLEYRKESKVKKLTDHGMVLSAKNLVKLGGENQMGVVDQSIANGWAGLFEIKGTMNVKKQNKISEFNNWLDGEEHAGN